MNCDSLTGFAAKPMLTVTISLVFILAAASTILIMRYFFSLARMYKEIRLKYIEKEKLIEKKAYFYVSKI